MLNEVYKEADVDPTKVSYVEISGSCNVDADAQEVNSVADVCCKDREKPLSIGSVKTNVGNTETASGDVFKSVLFSYDKISRILREPGHIVDKHVTCHESVL